MTWPDLEDTLARVRGKLAFVRAALTLIPPKQSVVWQPEEVYGLCLLLREIDTDLFAVHGTIVSRNQQESSHEI